MQISTNDANVNCDRIDDNATAPLLLHTDLKTEPSILVKVEETAMTTSATAASVDKINGVGNAGSTSVNEEAIGPAGDSTLSEEIDSDSDIDTGSDSEDVGSPGETDNRMSEAVERICEEIDDPRYYRFKNYYLFGSLPNIRSFLHKNLKHINFNNL